MWLCPQTVHRRPEAAGEHRPGGSGLRPLKRAGTTYKGLVRFTPRRPRRSTSIPIRGFSIASDAAPAATCSSSWSSTRRSASRSRPDPCAEIRRGAAGAGGRRRLAARRRIARSAAEDARNRGGYFAEQLRGRPARGRDSSWPTRRHREDDRRARARIRAGGRDGLKARLLQTGFCAELWSCKAGWSVAARQRRDRRSLP